MTNQREQNGMATPAEVPQRRNFNTLDWLTALSARFGAQRVFGAVANPQDTDDPLRLLRLANLEFQRRPECFDIFPLQLIQDVRRYVEERDPPLPAGVLGIADWLLESACRRQLAAAIDGCVISCARGWFPRPRSAHWRRPRQRHWFTRWSNGQPPRRRGRCLLLGGSELGSQLIHALFYRGEIERHLLELLHIGRRGGGRGPRRYVGRGLRNGCGMRCQPAKPRGRVRDHLSGFVAVGLPAQGGGSTDAKDD